MTLEEIKKEAARCKCDDISSLSSKITALKNIGVTFLGCVSFVQVNQQITLKEAQKLTLQLEAYTKDEKRKIEEVIDVMLSELNEEE